MRASGMVFIIFSFISDSFQRDMSSFQRSQLRIPSDLSRCPDSFLGNHASEANVAIDGILGLSLHYVCLDILAAFRIGTIDRGHFIKVLLFLSHDLLLSVMLLLPNLDRIPDPQ